MAVGVVRNTLLAYPGLRLRGLASRLRALRTAPARVPIGVLGAIAGLALAAVLWLAGLESAAGWAAIAGIGIGVGWMLRRREEAGAIHRPLDEIARSLETLAVRDVFALVDEFASLAQGDKARVLEVHATQVALPADASVRRVAEALNTTIARLQLGARQFRAASEEQCRRLFYVGADDYLLGCASAEAMGAKLPQGGKVLLLTASFRHAGLELRRRGFESTLHERFPSIQVAGALESRLDTNSTKLAVRLFIRTHPEVVGIYCSESTGVLGVIEALAGTELAGKTIVVCHDTCEGTIAGIQAGLIAGSVTQDPFGQGHDTAIHLFNAVAHGWRPPEPRLITTSDLITPDNYRDFWQPYEGLIEPAATAARRPRPLGPSRRHVRIAVLGLEDNPFWPAVRNGVLAAAEELAACNATAEWIVPEGAGSFDVSVRGPAVNALVDEGYDAIGSVNYDSDLVPYLNRAVDRGVVVSTLNAESSSLQGLVATLSKERKRLEIEASHLELAASHDALTGTLNRLAMDADLEEARRSSIASHKPAAVIMIDIDHFKAYNDTYGHAAGDEVLRIVAQRIQHETRPLDRLYRYGGEEFLVLLREARLEEGEAVAGRIAIAIATLGLANVGNPPWGILTISAGVAAIDPSSLQATEAVENADAALYRSKRSGRNTVATHRPEPEGAHGSGSGDWADRP